ncbi:amidohydrolase family protein [Clostridium akagii]|uniref:amidohydrolase family protein n=1 Tax=Clostridium akagii TaxID=91623 RepID=UPI000479177F|nr:amidohydrolase family protein [Clostridium akagii]
MIDVHCHMANIKVFSKYFINGIIKDLNDSISIGNDSNVSDFVKIMSMNVLSDNEGKKIIKQMDDAGIDKSVLLIIDLFYNSAECDGGEKIKQVHEYYLSLLKKYPDRFIVFAGIDPRRGKSGVDLFEKDIKEYNFKGLKLYPPCGFEINDKSLDPYYELCDYYHLPVLIHTGPSLKDMYLSTKYPYTLIEVAKKYKNVNFILAHAGILYYEEGLKLIQNYKNIYLDISGFERVSKNKTEFQEKMKSLFKYAPDKVLFGTDWPLYSFNVTQKTWVNYVKENSGLSDKKLEKLFDTNARKIIDI